jgi:hypothetical protein
MDALPPTLDAPPAIVRGTGLSRDMIGWHRCWQFLDHGRLGPAGLKPTNHWRHQKADEQFPNLIDDNVNLPAPEYGDLMYISAAKHDPRDDEEIRRRIFIAKEGLKYFFFLNFYSYTDKIYNDIFDDKNLKRKMADIIFNMSKQTRQEVWKINEALQGKDKIISLHKEMQFFFKYFFDIAYRFDLYPKKIRELWLEENKGDYQDPSDIFNFAKKYDGSVMIELLANGYWMLGNKFLYVRTQGEWKKKREDEIFNKAKSVLNRYYGEEISDELNETMFETINYYTNLLSHYDFSASEYGMPWVQRWQPIPVKRCTVAFKPLVEDPAMPEYLKPIFPKTSR